MVNVVEGLFQNITDIYNKPDEPFILFKDITGLSDVPYPGFDVSHDEAHFYTTTLDGAVRSIAEWVMDTPGNLGTLTYVTKQSISENLTAGRDKIRISPDGLHLMGWDRSAAILYSYTLSTAFDVTSLTKDSGDSGSTITGTTFGIDFNNDGTQCFIMNGSGVIETHTMSTAWLASSLSAGSGGLDTLSDLTSASPIYSPNDLSVSKDGDMVRVVTDRLSSSSVFEYAITSFNMGSGSTPGNHIDPLPDFEDETTSIGGHDTTSFYVLDDTADIVRKHIDA